MTEGVPLVIALNLHRMLLKSLPSSNVWEWKREDEGTPSVSLKESLSMCETGEFSRSVSFLSLCSLQLLQLCVSSSFFFALQPYTLVFVLYFVVASLTRERGQGRKEEERGEGRKVRTRGKTSLSLPLPWATGSSLFPSSSFLTIVAESRLADDDDERREEPVVQMRREEQEKR